MKLENSLKKSPIKILYAKDLDIKKYKELQNKKIICLEWPNAEVKELNRPIQSLTFKIKDIKSFFDENSKNIICFYSLTLLKENRKKDSFWNKFLILIGINKINSFYFRGVIWEK